MAERKALHVLALSSARQQDIGWQGFVVANKTVGKPSRVAFATGRRDHWAHRDSAGSVLPEALRPRWQSESRHRHRAQDRGAVLQCAASRHGIRRSWRLIL